MKLRLDSRNMEIAVGKVLVVTPTKKGVWRMPWHIKAMKVVA